MNESLRSMGIHNLLSATSVFGESRQDRLLHDQEQHHHSDHEERQGDQVREHHGRISHGAQRTGGDS